MTRASPQVITLGERDPRLFPRDALFDGNGRSLILQKTRDLKSIDMREIVEGVELRANGVIGYLPLTPAIVLNLIPKFPIRNLWRMLSLSDAQFESVLPILRTYEKENEIPPHQLLAKGFCHYLAEIFVTGVARRYEQVPYRGYFKPKVNFGETVGSYLSRGDELNVVSDTFVFSAHSRVNSLLKSACLEIIRLVPHEKKWAPDRKLILASLNALDSVRPARMRLHEQALALQLPPWLREAYLGALTVYAILLGYSRVGFGFGAEGVEMPSFLFWMDGIFESYVRNVFRNALKKFKIGVLDGNNPKHQSSLFVDSKRFPIKPDIIFRRNGELLGLGEIKYKPRLDEHDRYQLISHSVAVNAPFAFWISPAGSANNAGATYVGKISTGTKFFHYQIDISADIDDASERMVTRVLEMIRGESG